MAFSAIITVQDNKGKFSTIEIGLTPTITSVTTLINAAQALALLIDPLIKGRITKVGVGVAVNISSLIGLNQDPATIDSDVEEGARFQFLTDTGFYTGFRLPTFDEQFIVPGTDVVDVADPLVAALITAVVDTLQLAPAGGTGNTTIVDKRDASISALSSARESFQASRRRD